MESSLGWGVGHAFTTVDFGATICLDAQLVWRGQKSNNTHYTATCIVEQTTSDMSHAKLDLLPEAVCARLLDQWCRRTGKRSRKVSAPLYRLRLALSQL